ncbi:YrhK family protein [Colwellia sp. D2M02]|uniref:Zinc ribbon domain-containing protein n=1 Tax=Colwellia asteriadis TaxID=517723 RepID=A0ABN1L8F6_9GAMM|nr:YrhK family protein [Colwellia sp. D2M02]MBU2892505.1 YrhK family protein [Colwellia sp. D2M02]
MAVINCPSCKKKISDKAKTCSHCNISLNELDSEKMQTIEKINRINKKQRLMNYSFIAMLLFCGGFLFMYWDNVEPGTWQHTSAMVCAVIGFILYIVIRAMLLFTKHKK